MHALTQQTINKQAPYLKLKQGGVGIFDDTAIDPGAVLWREMHPDDEPCERCPNCIGIFLLSGEERDLSEPIPECTSETSVRP